MIQREASCRILHLAEAYPTVTVAGPRYSGKTTLVKKLFPHYGYVSLEDPRALEFSRKRPAEFFRRYSGKLIIDEFLRAPELLPHIRAAVKEPGQFILVTSHLPLKTGFMRKQTMHRSMQILLPLTIGELRDAGVSLKRDEYIHRGFMPRAYDKKAIPKQLYLEYLTSYVDHDAKLLINPYDRDGFGRFFKLLAKRIGQIINPVAFASELGIPQATLAMWMSALETSLIIFRLPCYYKTLGMRIARVPKFYFTDIGMAARLLKITSPEQVFRDPLVGNLFENMVIAEILKCRCNAGLSTGMYYFRHRRNNNLEVDLIVEQAESILPVEIKCSSTYDPQFARNVSIFSGMSKKIGKGCVVYGGEDKERRGMPKYINFKNVGGLAHSISAQKN
jgi:predicted AAA+ superfamily ATPase